jgi:hypothetical protein
MIVDFLYYNKLPILKRFKPNIKNDNNNIWMFSDFKNNWKDQA